MYSRFAFLTPPLKPIEAAFLMGPEATYAGVRLDIQGNRSHETLSGVLAAFARMTGSYPQHFQPVDLHVVREVAHVVLLAAAYGACLPIVDLAAPADPFHTGSFLDDGWLRGRLRRSFILRLNGPLRLFLNCSFLFAKLHLVITLTMLQVCVCLLSVLATLLHGSRDNTPVASSGLSALLLHLMSVDWCKTRHSV
ncbi:hypothetical protein AU210_009017 [Fusarium oxysporum f. sp. radicis-cucumerinum]|uniref:Uncharacterized protein n=2 Tax=Fusarium oxysporum TaxID=5507 RepID=A0A2H3GRH6_FUSOX|nr:hypothetical protein AU210_009017 [Fusarium oxysporum f. sp. radicis-cucumerinum]RKK51576.1 hypothetical protein BFJ66_g6073 [Fusarium oxysporum f. sp. cepae]